MNSTVEQTTLFQQLGGRDNIVAVVADFYDRVLADERLSPLFARVNIDRHVQKQTDFISYALGGPNEYSGRSLKRGHRGLGITEEQFNAVAAHLADSLAYFGVPSDLIDQVIGQVAALKGEITEQ
jgi:hemoglobin